MNRLLAEYRRVGWLLFVFAAAVMGAMFKLVAHSAMSPASAAILTSTAAYGLVYLGGLKLYERFLWAKLPWNRRLDCRGRWYFRAEMKTPEGTRVDSFGDSFIEQAALGIKMSGRSTKTLSWQVRSVAYDEQCQRNIAYTGRLRRGEKGALDNLCGIARFTAEHIGVDPRDKPDRLVFSCQEMSVEGGNAWASIDIFYTREKPIGFPNNYDDWDSGYLDTERHSQTPSLAERLLDDGKYDDASTDTKPRTGTTSTLPPS